MGALVFHLRMLSHEGPQVGQHLAGAMVLEVRQLLG
jgi:hypothetical protein